MTIGFMLWSMSSFDGQCFALCGKTIESLRRNVVTLMPRWLEGLFSVTERRSENRLDISCGGVKNTYYLFGGRDESSYTLVQGITLAGVLFDEVALMPRSFVEQAMARCSVDGSKFWFNCNPESPSHWFYNEWILKAAGRNVLYLHFTMSDNPSLTDKIRARYESMYTGVFYQRYVAGLWVRAEGLVYPMFSRDSHVIGDPQVPSARARYFISVDYGTVNPFAAGLYLLDPVKKRAVMLKELYYSGGCGRRVDNEEYYRMLSSLAGDLPVEAVVIDPSASSMIETINRRGRWPVVKADNDVINGIQDVTRALCRGELFFAEGCVNTFREFETYSWDVSSAGDRVIKMNDHSMDQVRYFCRTVLRRAW